MVGVITSDGTLEYIVIVQCTVYNALCTMHVQCTVYNARWRNNALQTML